MTRTLLIVDDDPDVVDLLGSMAEARGYDAHGTTDPVQTVPLARKWRVDAVLLDLEMSPLGGRDVLLRLKADRATAAIPVIIVTGLFDEATRSLCLRHGAADVVAKPPDTDDLFRRIDAAIAGAAPLS